MPQIPYPYSRVRWLKERAQAMTNVATDMLSLAKIYDDEADAILAGAPAEQEPEAIKETLDRRGASHG